MAAHAMADHAALTLTAFRNGSFFLPPVVAGAQRPVLSPPAVLPIHEPAGHSPPASLSPVSPAPAQLSSPASHLQPPPKPPSQPPANSSAHAPAASAIPQAEPQTTTRVAVGKSVMYFVTLQNPKDFKSALEFRIKSAKDVELVHILSFLPLLGLNDAERGECLLDPQRSKLRNHRWVVYLTRSRKYEYSRGQNQQLEIGTLQPNTCDELKKLQDTIWAEHQKRTQKGLPDFSESKGHSKSPFRKSASHFIPTKFAVLYLQLLRTKLKTGFDDEELKAVEHYFATRTTQSDDLMEREDQKTNAVDDTDGDGNEEGEDDGETEESAAVMTRSRKHKKDQADLQSAASPSKKIKLAEHLPPQQEKETDKKRHSHTNQHLPESAREMTVSQLRDLQKKKEGEIAEKEERLKQEEKEFLALESKNSEIKKREEALRQREASLLRQKQLMFQNFTPGGPL